MATKSETSLPQPGTPQDFLRLKAHDLDIYNTNGFLIARGMFASDEIDCMKVEAERNLAGASLLKKADRAGNPVDLAMWDRPQDDIYGMFSRNERVVKNVETLAGRRSLSL